MLHHQSTAIDSKKVIRYGCDFERVVRGLPEGKVGSPPLRIVRCGCDPGYPVPTAEYEPAQQSEGEPSPSTEDAVTGRGGSLQGRLLREAFHPPELLAKCIDLLLDLRSLHEILGLRTKGSAKRRD